MSLEWACSRLGNIVLQYFSWSNSKSHLSYQGSIPVVKNPSANAGNTRDVGLIPELGRSPGGRNGNPFWYSCLKNPIDRGAWRATVHGGTKSWTRLSAHWSSSSQAQWEGQLSCCNEPGEKRWSEAVIVYVENSRQIQ